MGGDIGHDEGVGMLLVGERSTGTRYRLSAPSRIAPTRIGNANSARAVASRPGPVNAGHRGDTGCTRSGSKTGRSAW
jgi:hypothetical protein